MQNTDDTDMTDKKQIRIRVHLFNLFHLCSFFQIYAIYFTIPHHLFPYYVQPFFLRPFSFFPSSPNLFTPLHDWSISDHTPRRHVWYYHFCLADTYFSKKSINQTRHKKNN